MLKTFPVLLVILTVDCSSFGEEAHPTETSIKVYRVADLVSENLFTLQLTSGNSTDDQQQDHRSETIDALSRLSDLIKTVCGETPVAVDSHVETLSLVVRHSADGHREVGELFEMLRQQSTPTISVEFTPLTGDNDAHHNALSEEDRAYLEELYYRGVVAGSLTVEDAQNAKTRIQDPNLRQQTLKVKLLEGRKASWGPFSMGAVTARIHPNSGSIQLRIDYITDEDRIGQSQPLHSQILEVPSGRSLVLLTYMADSSTLWLITPRLIKEADQSEAPAQTSAGPNDRDSSQVVRK